MEEPASLDQLESDLISCRKCPRLVIWREEVARKKRKAYQDSDYWGKPVPGFGDAEARLLIVGLAPGAHGSNRTGQMFTGDASGKFLFRALYEHGFASSPETNQRGDGLKLQDVFITAVCRCVPPGNAPTRAEIANCRSYLEAEISFLNRIQGIVTLGKIACDGTLAALEELGAKYSRLPFGHGVLIEGSAGQPWLLCSYHPSAQNTQTGRLTRAMFDQIWEKAQNRLNA